jgi:hypothetical protein
LLDAFLVGDDPFAGQGNRKFFSGKDIYQMVQTEAVDFGLNPDHATSVNDPLPRRHSLAHWGGHFGIGGVWRWASDCLIRLGQSWSLMAAPSFGHGHSPSAII